METKTPGIHSQQSFYDIQAISLVSHYISKTFRAMPDLRANDKWPNIDGYIELTDIIGVTEGTFRVQVKKMPKNFSPKLVYSFKNSKFINYCKLNKDGPILLIGVDLDSNNAYWIHINDELLNSLGKSRTVRFLENQVLDGTSELFIDAWSEIIVNYRTNSPDYERLKKAYAILLEAVTPAFGLTHEKFINIHLFLDKYNSLIDNEYQIVKKRYYPNHWKVGLAYYDYSSNQLSYSLYPIPLNKNDIQIKGISRSLSELLMSQGLSFEAYMKNNPIQDNPIRFATKIVEKQTMDLIKNRRLDHNVSDFLAREFVFAFTNQFHIQMGLKKQDRYLLKDIHEGFYKYLPVWTLKAAEFLANSDKNKRNRIVEHMNIDSLNQLPPHFDPRSLLAFISSSNRLEIERKVRKVVEANGRIPNLPIGSKDISFNLFIENLQYLKAKGMQMIRRPYRKKRLDLGYLASDSLPSYVFSKQDLKFNIKLIIKKLPFIYAQIVEANFPGILKDVPLLGKADRLVIVINLEENQPFFSEVPGMKMYFLRATLGKVEPKVDIVFDKDFQVYINQEESENTREINITFKGKKYQLVSLDSSSLKFPFENTPILSLVYDFLQRRFDEYFKGDRIWKESK